MKVKIKGIIFMFFVLIILQNMSFAETIEGRTIRLESYSGNVSIISGTDRVLNVMEKMRIFDGYTVSTSNESTAYLSIDNKKSIKLDQNTKISLVKKDKVNEIQVITGKIFFSVMEKLATDESLDVVTPTMALSIRGTTGMVSVVREESFAQLYSGKVVVKNGRGKIKEINSGDEVRESEIKEENLEIVKLMVDGSNIPSFSLNEINKNQDIKEEIRVEEVFELDKFTEIEEVNKKKEIEETNKQLEQIKEDKKQAEEEKAINTVNITKEPINVVKKDEAENDMFEHVKFGESKEIEGYEGEFYIFEIDEDTGTANFTGVTDFSGSLQIENSNGGLINISVDDDENSSVNLGGPEYEGGYVVLD